MQIWNIEEPLKKFSLCKKNWNQWKIINIYKTFMSFIRGFINWRKLWTQIKFSSFYDNISQSWRYKLSAQDGQKQLWIESLVLYYTKSDNVLDHILKNQTNKKNN